MRSRWAFALLALTTACGRIGFGEQSPGDATGDAAGPPTFALELPEGGAMMQIAIAPEGTWYARSESSGVWRSLDQGLTWTPCVTGPPAVGIAVGPDNAVYFTGTTMRISTDQCGSFSTINTARFSNTAGRGGAFVYALTDQGIERRSSGPWASVLTVPGTAFLAFASREGASPLLLAGSTSGLYSSDLGATFTARTTGFVTPSIRDVAVGATKTYAITSASPTSSGGISCSDADGATWTVCLSYGGTAIAVDPLDDDHVLAAVYDEFAESTDGFMTNTLGRRAAGGLSNALVNDIQFTPTGDAIVATNRGVFVWRAGTALSFESRNAGLSAWSAKRLLRDGDDLFVTTSAGLARSLGGAAYAIDATGILNDTEFNDVVIASNGDVIGIGRGIWRSTDRGATWTVVHAFSESDAFHGFSIALDGDRIIAGTTRRLLIASPPYTTWTPFVIDGNQHVDDLEVVETGALEKELWIGTSMGLYMTTLSSNPSTFTRISPVTGSITSIATLEDGGLVVGTSTGVWTTDAARTTWTPRLTLSTRTVLREGNIALAATSVGVLASRDGGASWTVVPESDQLGTRGLAIDPGSGEVVYGVVGRGLARAAIP